MMDITDSGYKASFSTENIFCCYAVLLLSRAATTEGKGKLPYFMYFPLLPVEAALSSFNFSFFV